MEFTAEKLASIIDHTVLSPQSADKDFEDACLFAARHGCASVCVCPFAVAKCALLLKNSAVKVCTVIGFPHGANATRAKAAEAEIAIEDGADELDMVVNISKVKDHDWIYVAQDIKAVTKTVHNARRIVKVIFENCCLNEIEKIKLCRICTDLGCDFVKTSTGFGSGGSTVEDIRLMRASVGPGVRIKAAGGIRNLAAVAAAVDAGADRIGCSRTADILTELAQTKIAGKSRI